MPAPCFFAHAAGRIRICYGSTSWVSRTRRARHAFQAASNTKTIDTAVIVLLARKENFAWTIRSRNMFGRSHGDDITSASSLRCERPAQLHRGARAYGKP